MNVNKPMDELTYEQKTEFRQATHCSICNKKFQPDDEKVRDHCHFTGKYRGAAHVKIIHLGILKSLFSFIILKIMTLT